MNHNISAAVRGRFDQVFSRYAWEAGDLCQFFHCQRRVLFRRVQASTDCRCAEVNFQQQFSSTFDVFHFFFQQDAESAEFLTKGHRHCVLQLSTAHFQDVLEFDSFTLKTFTQLVNGIDQFNQRRVNRDAETGWVGVVSGLTFVNVVVRIQVLVFTFLVTHQFQTDIGQHFVGVHVYGSTCAALVDVYRELIHAFSVVQDFITCGNDGIRYTFRNGLQLFVCHSCGFFNHYHTANKFRNIADFVVADVEVFNRSQSVNPIVGISWNFPGTQQIFFDTNVV